MIFLTESLTLSQRMNVYDKESLMYFAQTLGLRKISKLKKAELADKIAEKLLEPETMFYRASILTDREISVLEKGFDEPVEFQEKDRKAVDTLNEIDYIAVSDTKYFVTNDVASVWKQVKDEKFKAYQKRASWVWKCLYWAEEMYGYTPVQILLDVVNSKKGFRMEAEELEEIFDHFPEDLLRTVKVEDFFMGIKYVEDIDALDALGYAQADKSYYIPAADEVNELYKSGALLSGKEYQDMLRFLTKELRIRRDAAEYMLSTLWNKLSGDENMHDTLQWFWDQLVLQDDSQLEKMTDLYMSLANGTRMRLNRGHKPTDFARKVLRPGDMPVITAGSSHAAEMLAQMAPEIQRMGFKLDLTSNAWTASLGDEPKEMNSGVKRNERKIGRNEPCPCGSGKKYKNCCGRK